MKKKLIIVVSLCFVGLIYFVYSSKKEESSYHTIRVQRGDLTQMVTIAGNIVPEAKLIVTAPFSGYVKRLFVKVGDQVKQGDPLVTLTPSLGSTDPTHPLRSSFSGTVVQVLKDQGEYVKQDDDKDYIMRIDDLHRLYVISEVPEVDSVKIKNGQSVVIKATAILGKSYKGRVEELDLASNPQTGGASSSKVSYNAKISISNFDVDLKPGMSVIIDIVTEKKSQVLLLPHEFVFKEGHQYFALSPAGNRIPIQVGLQNESDFEITNGLSEGESVRQINFLNALSSDSDED